MLAVHIAYTVSLADIDLTSSHVINDGVDINIVGAMRAYIYSEQHTRYVRMQTRVTNYLTTLQ